jgi:hypothetical protein
MKLYIILTIICLAMVGIVHADDYTVTNAHDFNVWFDSKPYLDGRMFATVSIDDLTSTYRCISLVFTEENSSYIHVQSNPPSASSGGINLRVGAVTPEEKGYFEVKNGIGNVYFRDFNQVAGANFLYVVKCNSDNSSLTWEGDTIPGYREAGKTLPGRMTWLTSGMNGYWVAGIFVFIFGLIIAILIIRNIGRK